MKIRKILEKEALDRFFVCSFVVILLGVLTACGQDKDIESEEISTIDEIEVTNQMEVAVEVPETNEKDTADTADTADTMKEMFGENCISDQTFEVELSEYDGKVYFVSFFPSEEERDFHMQIIQDGEVLNEISSYVPEELEGEEFTSLDAVSFFDVNYDDNTDIVLIQTYGSTSYAVVYYGFSADADEYDRYFYPESGLSESIANHVEELTIPEVRSFLTAGKRNGEFISYKEAYEAKSRLCELESSNELDYDLIYFDEDEIPELVVGVNGYYVSLYTYSDGKLYTLMNHWGYGAMGNVGYEYSPGKNSLRNYNNDFAGAIAYTTYMSVNEQRCMETVAQIETYNFDDANGNGMPDEEEEGSVGYYSVSYIDGVEVTPEQCDAYDVGAYEYIEGSMDLETLKVNLEGN